MLGLHHLYASDRAENRSMNECRDFTFNDSFTAMVPPIVRGKYIRNLRIYVISLSVFFSSGGFFLRKKVNNSFGNKHCFYESHYQIGCFFLEYFSFFSEKLIFINLNKFYRKLELFIYAFLIIFINFINWCELLLPLINAIFLSTKFFPIYF